MSNSTLPKTRKYWLHDISPSRC